MNALNPYFIVNPAAGGRRGAERWEEFRKECERRRLQVHVAVTERRGHAVILAREAVRQGFTCIVAFGGDGTLNEALNGLLSEGSDRLSSLCLGLVGAGSSNDFLRSFRNGGSDFLENFFEKQTWATDVGRIECFDEYGSPIIRYFLVNSSIGLVPQALEFFNHQTLPNRIMKRVSVDLAVIASGLSAISRHRSAEYRLTEEAVEVFSGTLTNLAILKGPCFGGGMSYGLRALPAPGQLSVVGIGNMNRFERLAAMVRFYRGSILDHPKVWRRNMRSLEVVSAAAGLIEADGELVGFLPARYSLHPEKLQIIT